MHFFFLFSLLVNKISTGQRSTKNRLCALCTPKDALQHQANTKAELSYFWVNACPSAVTAGMEEKKCFCPKIPEWPQDLQQVLIGGFAICDWKSSPKISFGEVEESLPCPAQPRETQVLWLEQNERSARQGV